MKSFEVPHNKSFEMFDDGKGTETCLGYRYREVIKLYLILSSVIDMIRKKLIPSLLNYPKILVTQDGFIFMVWDV